MKKQKAKSNVHTAPVAGPGYGDDLPLGSAPPVRSTDPHVQNTPASPACPSYEGDAASQASPSGDNPPYRTKQ